MIARISSFAVAFLAATASAALNPFEIKKSPSGAKAAYVNKLVNGARPTKNSQIRRKLEDNNAEVEVDISTFYLKFDKCQFVKAYSEELAQEGADTVLAADRFVIFRLCPSETSCNSGYGEYIIEMETYLGYTVEYRTEEQEEMCNTCDEYCAQDDAAAADDAAQDDGGNGRRLTSRKLAIDCDECTSDCEKIAQMEDNKYLDATNFINCANIGADDDGSDLYAGPMCGSYGSKIKIGVFTDENCMFLDATKEVENYLADGDGYEWKLSHALLKTTYDNSELISCLDVEEAEDDQAAQDDQNAEVATKEICTNLYEAAAKCETTHGFDNGLSAYSNYYDEQLANEELVCDFIYSLKSGTYSVDGEIVVGGSSSYSAGGTSTTGGQKFALTFFILGTVGLAVYSAMLHSQLTSGGNADLSAQGGAMA